MIGRQLGGCSMIKEKTDRIKFKLGKSPGIKIGVFISWMLLIHMIGLNVVEAAGQAGPNHQIPADVFSGGGNASSSSLYTNQSSIGQVGVVGSPSTSTSSGQEVHHGLWPMVVINDPVTGLESLENLINDLDKFPVEWFKGNNNNRRTPLTNKIDVITALLQSAEAEPDPVTQDQLYTQAFNKLSTDILAKTDGCANSTPPAPDNNDWVDECAGQNEFYPLIQTIILVIQDLI
jgi:hypothetical protein